MELGRRLVGEVETRTSVAIQSGKFVKCYALNVCYPDPGSCIGLVS